MARTTTVGAPGNIQGFGTRAWGVGNLEFLNSQESKVNRYWRLIEQGTDIFVGRRISGLWGDQAEPRGGLHQGTLSAFGAGAGQKLVPFSKNWGVGNANLENIEKGRIPAWNYLRKNQGYKPRKGTSVPGTAGTITKPIPKNDFFNRAVLSLGGARALEKEAINEAFRGIVLPGQKVNRASVLQGALGIEGVGSKGAIKPGNTLSLRSSPVTPLFVVAGVASANVQSFNRGPTGRFEATVSGYLQRAHAQIARRVADRAAEEFRATARRQVRSGRLERAIVNPRNFFPHSGTE